MKKFSVVLSILAGIAALVGIYFAVVEYLKRKGYFSDDEEYDDESPIEEPCEECEDENMSFNEDEEISFMEEEAAPEEENK